MDQIEPVIRAFIQYLLDQPLPLQLAVISGLLQILGYLLYVTKQLHGEVRPNPATWLMFAYGTALLTALEIDIGASWQLLILPVSCAVLSILVALICWRKGHIRWPEPLADKIAFGADIVLTMLYLAAWALQGQGSISESERDLAVILFLVCSNLTTFTAFSPLLRQAYREPSSERSSAWLVWTLAYSTLALLTFRESENLALLIYPVSNMILHGTVAILVRPSRRRRYLEKSLRSDNLKINL